MEQINFFRKRFLLLFILTFISWTFSIAQNAGPDQDVACDNTTLGALDPSGVWTTSGSATIIDPTNPNTTVTGLVSGTNTFTWTVGGNSDDVIITYYLANAGADLPNECSSAVLAASNPAPLTGYWIAVPSGIVFDDSTSPTATVSNLPVGSTNLTWTITSGAGCSNSDVMSVTNNTPVANAGADDEACNNNSIQLNANDPSSQGATGQWTIISGAGSFTDATLFNTVVSAMNQDNNEYQWTVTSSTGCSASDNVIITNNTVTATASNQEVCATTATLDGNDPATFGGTASGLWTTVGGTSASITNANQYNTGVTGLDPDANQFNWQITKGSCSDDITITITNNSIIANAGPDQNTLCADNTVLAANTVSGASGQWSVVLGSGSFADNTLSNTAVAGLSSDWNEFTWTLTKGSCTDADNVRIRNILPNTADAGPNQSVCGTTASLSGNAVTTPNSAGIWTVISGGAITFVDDTDPTTNIDGLANGDNILNWRIYSTIDGTCFSDDQVTITNISLTGVTAGPNQNVCGTTATLAGSDPGSGSGVWTLISGSGSPTFPTLSNTPVTGLGQGPNTFEWTVTGGTCSGSDQVVIYNDFPSTANAGADGESCDGTYVLAANDPVIGTGMWSSTALGPVFANNTVFNTTVSNLNNGINTLTWTITNGACSDADDVVITNNTVTTPNAGANQQACTDTYTLAAQDPIEGTGQWSVVTGTAAFADATLFNTTVVVQRGDNQLRWTVTKGTCSAYDDVVISNYSVTANAGLDNYTCDGTYTLQGNDPAAQYINIPGIAATGTWTTTGPAAIANINLFNTGISGLNSDANTFTWTIDNGFCSASDDVIISNDMPTVPQISTNDTTFCGVDFSNPDNGEAYSSVFNALHANSPDLIRGGVGETGVWTQIAGSGTFLDASTSPDMRVDNLAQYAQLTGPDFWSLNPTVNTFRWTITYKNCTLYDEVTITNAAPNLADAGPDQRVCFDEANLNALDHGSRAQTHVWTESAPGGSGAVIDDPNAFNSYVYSLQSDTTTFRWTKTNVINGITCLVWDETQIIKTNNTGRPNAGPNQILCATEADMSASPADIGFPATDVVSGQWSVLIGTGNFADITDPSTHVTNLAYRTNIFRWTVTNTTQNCIATDDVEITNALPSNANAGPDQYVCTNTALLSADRPTRGTGEWSVIGGGGTISNTTCQNFSCNVYVSNMGTGKNTFLWTMSNSYTDPASGETKTCTLTDEIQVWNNEVTAEAGLDQTVCVDNATLSATAPGIGETGQWTVTGGSGIVTDISLYNSVVTNLSPNVNTFRWRLSNTYCSDEDYMTITNNNPTDPSVSVPSTDICVNYTQINANNPTNGTGLWSVTTGGGTIANPSLASTTASGLIVGLNEFTWTITKNGCSESATVQVYNKSVTADAGTDIDNICGIEPAISSVNLAATSPNYTNGESGTWTVVTGVGTVNIVDPTAFNTQVTGMDDGVNTFRWTITNGTCSANDMVNVHVYIPTTAATNPDREVCASLTDIEVLTANPPDPGRGTGSWTLVSGGGAIADPTSNVTNVTNLGYNENRFRWTINNNGCTSTDDIILTNNYVIADAGPDQSICTDVATLAANDPTVNDVAGLAQASGKWTVVQGSGVFVNDTQYDTQVSGLSTAVTNILRWTVSKGSGICSVYDDVSIINNEFTITAGVDQTVCTADATLNGQQPGANQTGLWTLVSGGGSFVNQTLYNTQVNGLSINPNIFRWTVTNTTSDNCSANDLVTVYYNKVEANAGVDDRICVDNTSLNGNLPDVGASGNWVATFGGASITTPSSNTTAVTNLGTGQNTFEWTVSRTMNGQYCEAKDYVNIYNDTPTTALVEADKEVCNNATSLNVVTIPTEGIGLWSAVDNTATIDNISSLNANATGLNRGINTFRWTVTKNACSSTDDLVITNNEVIANAGVDKSTACADNTTLSANDPTLTQGTGIWVDLSGTSANIASPTLYNTSVTNLAIGATQFQWTVSLGSCSQSDIVVITNNQITATAGVDQTICNDFYGPLDGNDVSGIGGTGIWTSIGNTANITDPTLFNTGVTGLDPGLNTFRWTVTSAAESCTDFDEVGITNNGVVANAGIDFETCDANITLNATVPVLGTGVWTQTGGLATTIVNSLQENTQVTGLTGGVYTFNWTVTEGVCSATDEVIVTNSTPSVSMSSTSTAEVCNNAAGVLNANPLQVGESGLWTKVDAGGTINDPTSPNTTVSNMQLGNNTFRWTISKGNNVTCISTSDVVITNNTVVANAGPDQDICSTSGFLAGNNPNDTQGTGTWTKIGLNPATIANPTLYNSAISNLSDNTSHGFTWTVTLGTCSASDDVYINNNMVVANAGVDEATCNNYYKLNGNDVSSTGATGLWTKLASSTASFVSPTVYNTDVNGLEPGINRFTWTITSGAGCISSDAVEITYNEVTANAGIDMEICDPSTTLGAVAPTSGSGVWTQLSGTPVIIANSTDANSAISGLTGGNYAFTWTVTYNGCSDADDVLIINSAPQNAIANTSNTESCDGTGTLIGNAPGLGESGLWSKVDAVGTFADATAFNTTVSGMKQGDNIFKWTLSKGNTVTCTSEATVTITNNEITTVSASSATGSNISCDGTASLVGTDPSTIGATGVWTASTAAVFADNTAFTTTASNLADGANIFTWSLSKGTCPPVSADVTITNNQVIANAGPDKTVCGSITSLAAIDPAPGTGLWTIVTAGPSTVIQNSSDPNSTVTGLQPGANVFKWTTTRSSCSDEDFVTITNDTVQIADGTTQTVCAFEADLVANPLDAGQTGLWTAAGSNPIIQSSTSPTTHVTNLDYGTNAFFWTVTSAGGCSTTKQYNIINNSPTPANAGVDQPLCVDYATVTGNNPIYGTGTWSLSSGAGSIVDANSTSTLINNLGAGTNVFRWTISYKGCTDFDEVNLINNSFTVKAGIDQDLCVDNTTLDADAIAGGYWTLVSGSGIIQNSLSNTSNVTNLGQGANTFRWTAVQGTCTASDDVIVSNNSVAPPSVLGGGEYCVADGITITGDVPTGTQTGLWTLTGGSGTIAVATDNVTTVSGLSNLTPNKFTWTITDKGCSASAELTIINNSVTADAGGNQTLCADNTNLGAAIPAVGTGYWTVASSTGIIANSLANNSAVTNLNLGNNLFTWTVERGICSASDDVLIINDSPTTANAGSDQTICFQTTTLNGNSPLVGTGKWSTLSSTAIIVQPTQFDTQVIVDIGSSTQFTWTITNGVCSSDDIITVTNNSFNVYAGINRTLCTDTHVMEADDPGTGTGEWTILSGTGIFSNSAQYNATVTSLGLGENIFRWTITRNGCSVYDDVKLINRMVSASANNQFLCVDNTILDGNDPSLINSQGIWSVVAPAGANITTPTLFNSAVTDLTSGKNYLKWTVYNQSCSEEQTVEIEYYVPVVNAGGDVPFRCDNQIQLDGNQPPSTGSGIWSSVSGSTISDPTLYNTQVTNLDIGDNVFRWTITDKGCTNWDEVVINNSLPENDNGSDQSGCTETFVMNAEQPTATGSGLWTVVSSSGTVVFADNTLYSTIVTVPSGNNILKWTITDNGCSNEKTFNITNNLPNAIASNGDTLKVCRDEVQLSGSQPGVGESGVWTIDGGIISEVFDNASIYNPIVSNLRKGQITFVWTVSNAYCTDEDRAVVVNNTPVVDAGSDRTICEDQINLAANIPGSGENGLWTINSTTVVIDNPTLYNTHVSNLGNTNTFRWTIDNGICTAFDEVIITSRNIDVSAGLAYQEACADTLVLEATDPSTVGSGTGNGFWTAIEGSGTFDNASSYTTIARNLRNYNKLRWTIVDLGCTYYDEIAFVSLLPTEALTGLDKPVCTNTTQITGSTPDYSQGESGLWTVASGTAQISDATAFQTVVTNLNSGTNVFRWTISNASCSDEDYITITNNEVFADAGTDQSAVCDSSATISANLLSGTGYWTTTSPTATIQNSLATTTLVEHLSFGANNFQWIVSNNGCSDVDEVIVTSILPRNVDAGFNQNICTDNTNLAASNPGIGTGLWQNTGGAGTVADPTANQTTVSGLANNENRFTWTVTVNGCSETDEVSIFNNSIYVNAGTDQTICNQDTLVLNGTTPGSGITGTWSVRGGSGTFDNASVYNTVVRGIAKGINTYRWTLSDGNCTNYAELTVTNNTPDSAIVGSDQFICTDNTIINSIPVTNGTGSWDVTSGAGTIVNRTSNNTSVTGINKGPNTFTWTVNKNGCQLSADLVVTNNSVDAYIADNEVVICTNTHTATIIGNAPGTGETGYWVKQNPADAGIIVNSNSNVTNVTNLANGDTYFTWTIENGLCSNSDVVKVTDNYYNTTATPAGPNTLCVDYSPILGGTPPAGGTGRWSSTAPDVTFDNDTKVSTIVRNLPGGTSAITWTVTKDGCSAPASFNLINNAIYTSAGADQIVCTDYTTMNAQALLSGETGQWTVNNSSVIITDTSDPTTSVSNLIPGANTFTWTIQGNGCTATDEIIVSANAFSVTAGNDDIACGTTYNLAASDPLTGTGLWTVASGTGRFANASNFETAVYDIENGTNTFTWTVHRNGCVSSDDVTITNNLYIAVAGDDKSVCSDQTTVSAQPLNPVWGATGMWTAQTGGGVFTDPTNESTLVTGLAVGNNRLRWTVTKTESGTTCISYDEMVVTNNSVTASAGTNETTCDDFTTLSATPLSSTATGLWSGGGVTTTIVNPTSATTLVTGLQQGVNTFSWTVKDNGCEGTSSVQITSNHFVANAGGDQIVTVNTATMNALLPDVTATGTWTTISGSGTNTNPNDPSDVVTALGYGVNTFRWEVTWNSCTNYDDVNITYNSITADAGTNQTICASSTTMNAGDPFPGTGTWSVISGSATIADINNPNTQVTDIQPGSLNILRWTVEIGGYSEYDDVSILNGEFNISAGIDKEECTNESVMTAEDPGSGTGSWSVLVGGGNFDDNSLNTSRVTNLDEGINLFVWSVTKKASGCSNSDTVQIIYNLPPSAAFEMDQSDGCSPIDVTFTNTTTGGNVYYWYFKNDFRVDSSLTSFTRTYEASYNADSTYSIQLIAESSKGCTDTVVHTVTVYRIPRVDFSATPSSQLYPRTEVFVENLSGSGYSNYYWNMGDGNTYLHNTLVENFSHVYATWGEYTITLSVSSNNCSDTASATVIIYPPQPESTIKPGVRAQGCEDLSVNFESYVNYADTFYWDFGDGGSSNEQNPTYIYDTPGTFIVTLYAGGPGTNDSLITIRRDTVVVFEVPIADFEAIPDTVMLPDQPVILHNNSINGDRYQWTFGGVGDAVSTEKSPVHYYTEPGIYTITLEVWTENDCYDTKTIENAVVVEPAGTFVFPTAFNPYSSYEPNKVFKPKYRGIKEYKLEVYNRWGEKVFESTDPEVGWNGYIDGKIGAQDVYAWKVTGKYKNGAPFQATGDVTLLR